MTELVKWSFDEMLEVKLTSNDDFLKIAETLTRIGISNNTSKTIFQTCHILHKRGKYYITHFKELFALDGREHTLTIEDIKRRNLIASLLSQWGMCIIVDEEKHSDKDKIQNVHVIKFGDKDNWNLKAKYKIGH